MPLGVTGLCTPWWILFFHNKRQEYLVCEHILKTFIHSKEISANVMQQSQQPQLKQYNENHPQIFHSL